MISALKYVHLLSVVIWLGSVIFFSLVATPAIFKNFERKVAGDIVGTMFPKYFMLNEVALALALVTLALLGLKTGFTMAVKVGLVLVVVALLAASVSGFYIGPKARAIKAEYRAETDEAKVTALKKSFGKLHGVSMALNMLNLLLGLGLLWFALRYLGQTG